MATNENNFEIFPWNSNFETEIKIIDEQHKKLVFILNKLATNLANLSNKIVLNEIFDELANYADYHFKTEESIWEEYFLNDKAYLEHLKTHNNFINDVIKLKNSNKNFEDTIYDIIKFLSKWLAYHILDTDKRMAKVVLHLQKGESFDKAKIIAEEEMKGSTEVLVNTVLTMYESLSTRTLSLMREKALRIKAEKNLYENEERWKLIVDGGLDDIWDISFKYKNLFDISLKDDFTELLNTKILKNKKNSKIKKSDITRLKEDFQKHIEGKSKYFASKFRMINSDNSWSWILCRGKIVSKDENSIRLVGTNLDITQKEIASIIYQNSSQAMCVSDFNNRIININPAFTNITGYSYDEVVGQNPNILSSNSHSEKFYKEMWKSINETGSFCGEVENRRKNGEIFSSILNINAVNSSEGIVDHYVGLFTDINEKKKFVDKIKVQANYDSLTNIFNRRVFEIQLNQAINNTNRTKSNFALFFIDLDNFKNVNDTLGHEYGDRVLIEASKRINENIRKSDILCRYGGDEFTLILPNLSKVTHLDNIANKIIESIAKPINIQDDIVNISASIGIAIYPLNANDSLSLLDNADKAMYEAKKLGKNRFKYYDKDS